MITPIIYKLLPTFKDGYELNFNGTKIYETYLFLSTYNNSLLNLIKLRGAKRGTVSIELRNLLIQIFSINATPLPITNSIIRRLRMLIYRDSRINLSLKSGHIKLLKSIEDIYTEIQSVNPKINLYSNNADRTLLASKAFRWYTYNSRNVLEITASQEYYGAHTQIVFSKEIKDSLILIFTPELQTDPALRL